MKRVRVRVYGDVQGVFFRYTTKKTAKKLGLFGWCQNEGDGSVHIVVEGEDKNVDKFVEWAKKGPPMARVKEIKVNVEKEEDDLKKKFEVR